MTEIKITQAQDISEADNPSVGWNLSGAPTYYAENVFLDFGKQRQEWWVNGGSVTSRDANGDVTGITGNTQYWAAIMDGVPNAAHRGGTYVLTWDGEPGVVNVTTYVSNVDTSVPNQVTFDVPGDAPGETQVRVTPTDWVDYPRNFRCVRTDHQAAYDAGEIFTPEFLALSTDAACLRFMDWGMTNNSEVSAWADRVTTDAGTWISGVPWEIQIEAANQTGAQPWFCIPHLATDDYITQAAALVAANLDPDIIPIFEYSNEVWNDFFAQARWADAQTLAEWGVEWQKRDWYAKRSTEMSVLIRAAFGDRAVRTVMAWQQVSPTGNLLTAPVWQANEPGNWVDPASQHDALACAGYFGGGIISSQQEDILAAMAVSQQSAVDLALAKVPDAITYVEQYINSWKSIADSAGMALYIYEHNQHNHLSGSQPGVLWNGGTTTPVDGLSDLYEAVNYSPEMAAFHQDSLTSLKGCGVDLIAFFSQVKAHNSSGTFGALRHYADTNPVYPSIAQWSAATPRWWLK